MSIVQRIKEILTQPRQAWPRIAEETTTPKDLYLTYIIPLVAVSAIAGFIGATVVGVYLPFQGTYRASILSGLGTAVSQFVLGLAMVYLIVMIVNALAPRYGGRQDMTQALKVVAYSGTPAWLASVFQMIPGMRMLGVLGLYSIYLFYTGLPVVMKSSPERALGYTALTGACGFVLGIAVGMMTSIFTEPSIDLSKGPPQIAQEESAPEQPPQTASKAPPEPMEDFGEELESAPKKLEDAKPKTPEDLGKALSEFGKALGMKKVVPIKASELKAMMPQRLGNLARVEVSAQQGGVIGLNISYAEAVYEGNDQRVELKFTDVGSLGVINPFTQGWLSMSIDKETPRGYEKYDTMNGHKSYEKYDNTRKSGELTVFVADRFVVEIKGSHVDMATLKQLFTTLDLDKLAAAKSESGSR